MSAKPRWEKAVAILLALLLNEIRCSWFKRTVQTVSYMPYFISLVVTCSLIKIYCQENGLFSDIAEFFGGTRQNLMINPGAFRSIYVISGIWQSIGWNSIIYLSALAGIDPQLHEAAKIDGAGRIARILHINIPGILPTIVILLILNVGQIMNIGFEKVFLLQNDLNISASDIISTFSYSVGIQGGQYSFASAIGLFNSIVNFILLLSVNKISRKLTETSLW